MVGTHRVKKAALIAMVGMGIVASAGTAASAEPRPGASPESTAAMGEAPYPAVYTGDGVNIRVAPDPAARSDGQGFRGDALRVHCWGRGPNHSLWLFTTNDSRHLTGWSDASFIDLTGEHEWPSEEC